MDAGVDPNYDHHEHGTLLIYALKKSVALDTLETLIKRGADVNLNSKLFEEHNYPIITAVISHYDDNVLLLIKYGANLNVIHP
jgi:ankyrin repeat protein